MKNIQAIIEKELTSRLGCSIVRREAYAPQGMLNTCMTFDTDQGKFFVKINSEQNLGMFRAEAASLKAIKDTGLITVPTPYFADAEDEYSYLVMEHLSLRPHTPWTQRKLGEQLARMHLARGEKNFGFEIDNTVGTTPQINTWTKEWVPFFVEFRLEHQLRLLEQKYGDAEIRQWGEKFIMRYPSFFAGLKIVPSLLHGDLWSGNTAADSAGNPVVYDPAVYYGHHEAEFGILLMFGGFSQEFHDAYRALIPKEAGFDERQLGYQLYHYLNHYYIFGNSYRPTCMALIKKGI